MRIRLITSADTIAFLQMMCHVDEETPIMVHASGKPVDFI